MRTATYPALVAATAILERMAALVQLHNTVGHKDCQLVIATLDADFDVINNVIPANTLSETGKHNIDRGVTAIIQVTATTEIARLETELAALGFTVDGIVLDDYTNTNTEELD